MTKFGNDGTLDTRAFTVFGLHAKENEDSIGRFGTGLKYAIATCLRNDRKVEIKANGETYKFTTLTGDFRGNEYQQILCNDEPLPYTTELGKDWELWQAFREFLCNAIDEGGEIDYNGSIIIEAELDDIDMSSVMYDYSGQKLVTDDLCEVYEGPSDYVWHQGVRVAEQRSLFTYDLRNIDLTEDRHLKYGWELQYRMANSLAKLTDEKAIKELLFDYHGYAEETLNYQSASEWSKEILEACEKHKETPNVHQELIMAALGGAIETNERWRPKPAEKLTKERQNTYDEFYALANPDFVDDIIITDSLVPFGMTTDYFRIIDGKIYISTTALDKGSDWLYAIQQIGGIMITNDITNKEEGLIQTVAWVYSNYIELLINKEMEK